MGDVELGNILSPDLADRRLVESGDRSSAPGAIPPPVHAEFAVFTALELEHITGMPHHLQRLWRHRGHLPQRLPYAPARYTSLELAQLSVRYRLSLCSVPPSDSYEIAEHAGRTVLLAALGLVEGACADSRVGQIYGNLAGEFQRNAALSAYVCGVLWPADGRYLWTADGSGFQLGPLMDARLRDGSYETFLCIDLFAMATRIARRAGRPLVTLQDVPADQVTHGAQSEAATSLEICS